MLAINDQALEPCRHTWRLKLQHFFGDEARRICRELCTQEISSCSSLAPVSTSSWRTSTHVAVGSDHVTGRVIGLTKATRLSTTQEPFLLIEHIFIDHPHNPRSLLRRLMAMVLLRVAGIEGMPAALALRTAAEYPAGQFMALAHHFTGAICYPPPPYELVRLATAQLSRRIAEAAAPSSRYDVATSLLHGARHASSPAPRQEPACGGTGTAPDLITGHRLNASDEKLLVIDFRSADETVLLDDARRAYRRR